jgi:hypothetical protein
LRGLANGASPASTCFLFSARNAHLADGGDVAAFQPLGHVFQRADIGGDILTLCAVTPGGGGDEFAALVAQRHRQAVDLGLGGKIDLVVGQLQEARNAIGEVADVRFRKGVIQ